MERKLELKEIIGYLPYGLMGMYKNVKEPQQVQLGFRCLNGRVEYYINDNIKPILRPLSDLYATITHNGQEIVPVMEIAKAVYPEVDWEKCSGEDVIGYNDGIEYQLTIERIDDCIEMYCIGIDDEGAPSYTRPGNTLKVFDYISSIFIDFRGLIDANLAIDCNTLTTNPYK